jgi:hypothetical protein
VTSAPEHSFDPRAILASLERSRTDYVVIGGLARVLRGADEVTDGVDICPSLTGGSLDHLSLAMLQLDARRTDGTDRRINRESLSQEPIIELTTRYGQINLVASPAGIPRGHADLRRAATPEPLGDALRPYVATVGDLAAMAAALHRDQDVERLPELRRIMELEADRPTTIGPAAAIRGAAVRSTARHGLTGGSTAPDGPERSGPKLTP